MKRNGDASKAFARKEKWFGEFSFSTKYDLEVMGGREADRMPVMSVRSKLMSPVRHETDPLRVFDQAFRRCGNFAGLLSKPGKTVWRFLLPRWPLMTSPSTERKSVVSLRSRPSFNCSGPSPGHLP